MEPITLVLIFDLAGGQILSEDGTAYDILPRLGMEPQDTFIEVVLISLFTWASPGAGDPSPPEGLEVGWWGDFHAEVDGDKIGSRLWRLIGRKLTAEILPEAEGYIVEAFVWAVDLGIFGSVEAVVTKTSDTGIKIALTIVANDGETVPRLFPELLESASGR